MRSLLTVSLGPMLLARDLEVTSTTWRHFRDRFSFCDSLKEVATHSSILAREIPYTEEPGGLPTLGSQELDTTERLNNSI